MVHFIPCYVSMLYYVILDEDSWRSFRDLFLNAVGERTDLSGAQKLQYLKSFVEGEAAQVLRPYSVADGNYRVAWAALDARYNNTRLLVQAHFRRLFGQPVINSESTAHLRQLIDTTSECVQSLRSHELPTDQWDAVLVYIMTQRLDPETHKQWEVSLADNELPTFKDICTFLEKRCRSLEVIGGTSSPAATTSRRTQVPKPTMHHVTTNAFAVCAICRQQHTMGNCGEFRSMTVAERRDAVKSHRLCFMCLKGGHISANCSAAGCGICGGKHHELLHYTSTSSAAAGITSEAVQSHHLFGQENAQVLLATAWVTINESPELIRIVLDQGSQVSIIKESCLQRFGLRRNRVTVPVKGVGGIALGTSTAFTSFRIRSRFDSSKVFDVAALVLKQLTGLLPTHPITETQRPTYIDELQLADPQYYEPGHVDIIVGADLYGLLLLDGLIPGSATPGNEIPTAQNTALGWIISGKTATLAIHTENSQVMSAIVRDHVDMDAALKRFWEIEEVVRAEHCHTPEEIRCEAHFVETHQRDDTGRYIVRLPFATSPPQLGSSRDAAARRLGCIERRLNAQPKLREQYHQFMSEYADLGHMQLANGPPAAGAYYLPHHFVTKESSTTTKLRVVFDASAKSSTGKSLNDWQLIGPRLQADLATLVMRFRRHAVALTADIAKMYRQVRVHGDDLDYQRILWRNNTTEEVREWQLTTVTYGMAASPYLVIRALQQLAKDEQQNFPRPFRRWVCIGFRRQIISHSR